MKTDTLGECQVLVFFLLLHVYPSCFFFLCSRTLLFKTSSIDGVR